MSAPAFTVAIDGPAAAGKGTIARAVARHFGFAHLDTGLLYRAVGALTLDGADPVTAARALDPRALEDARLRTANVAQAASRVAVIPEVRAALLEFQRGFARRPGGAVLDGRDICTVISPGAEAQFFVTASPDVRADRRWRELRDKGDTRTLGEVLDDVIARDARDSQRDAAPMRPAEGSMVLDTSEMSIDAAVAAAIAHVEARGGVPLR
ncbi:(d)CMP kinase [Tateyamaria omphalii]|uniref:Cytidylate kinase n=1 Tax=Tateyamaria omphalii TaxID=299262 RepID=A0A1P8MS21_9RHOB|nr:d(CMP) kinase [Tateyamaria omphalii]APX10876.1 cytidylate kinase [Tateyamaria omphalii]